MNIERIKKMTEYLRKTTPARFNQLSWCNCFAHHTAILFNLPVPQTWDCDSSDAVNDVAEFLGLNVEDKEILFYGIYLYRNITGITGFLDDQQRVDYYNFLRDPVRIADAIDKYVDDQERQHEPT